MKATLPWAYQEHLNLLLLALFFSLVTCFIAWYKGYFKPLDIEPCNIKVRLVHVVGAFLVYFAFAAIASFIIYLILASSSPEKKEIIAQQINAVKAWVSNATMLIVFLGLLGYTKLNYKEIQRDVFGANAVGASWLMNLKNFGMGFVTLIICFPLSIATTQIAEILLVLIQKTPKEQVAVRFLKSASNNPVAYIISCLFAIVIIPAVEELLFRGFLQNWLTKKMGVFWGIVSASLVFAMFHFSPQQGWGNVEIIPSLFVLTCFLGYIYFRQRSIFASIGLHATYNGANVLLMTFTSLGGS